MSIYADWCIRNQQCAAEQSIANAQIAQRRAKHKYDDAKTAVVSILHASAI